MFHSNLHKAIPPIPNNPSHLTHIMNIYRCETCQIETPYRQVFDRHVTTKRHIERTAPVDITQYTFICPHCSLSYASRSGLIKHSKKCGSPPPLPIDPPPETSPPVNVSDPIRLNRPTTSPIFYDEDLYSFNYTGLVRHYQEATNIAQFLDQMEFTPQDHDTLTQSLPTDIVTGLAHVLLRKIRQTYHELRPVHILTADMSRSNRRPHIFFIRVDDQWDQESIPQLQSSEFIEGDNFETYRRNFAMFRLIEDYIHEVYMAYETRGGPLRETLIALPRHATYIRILKEMTQDDNLLLFFPDHLLTYPPVPVLDPAPDPPTPEPMSDAESEPEP